MQANKDYDYFFEVDGERKYDFDLDFRTVDLFNYSKQAQNGTEAFCDYSGRGQTQAKRDEMPIVPH